MNCTEFERIACELVPEGVALPAEAQAHASACAACALQARRLGDERRLAAAFAALRAEPAPEPDAARLAALRRALRERPHERARPGESRWLAAAAALLVLATAVTLQRAARVSPAPSAPRPDAVEAASAAPPSVEITTEFFPLTQWTEDLEIQGARVVRVELPRTTRLAAGFPMNAERADEPIQADVLVGYDGVARALRFVQ